MIQRRIELLHNSFEDEWEPLEILAHLTEELGELAKAVNPKKKDDNIGEEMADMIISICSIANIFNIDLDDEIKKGLRKKEARGY